MASAVRGVWAIDIGSNSLKALRLQEGENGLEVIGFDFIEHRKILSGGGVTDEEKEQIIIETLGKFAENNEVGKEEVAISIAGHNSFSRFIKLPPVEQKRIPEIVQFEAVQQIPFEIGEVEWDWQLMENPDSPDTEVGIFAIKNEVIEGVMDHFAKEGMKVTCVQILPMALYNYVYYDRKDLGGGNEKPIVIIDMGAENTTLVVCTKNSVWQRSIRIGGNAFTEAIADTFNLSFQKAEKLKRTALMSKYIRQIFSAMKPVYTDLGSEVQRSLGFYSSSVPGRESGFSKFIALGGGMKLKGLAKYLQQTLGVPVVKPDSFEQMDVAEDVSAAKFHQNVSDFGTPYGLAVQLLGYGRIESNLLPARIARSMAWARKSRVFIAAACLILFVMVLSVVKVNYDKSKYKKNDPDRRAIASVVMSAKKSGGDLKKERSRQEKIEKRISRQVDYFQYRDVVPALIETLFSCLPNEENNPQQKEVYAAFEKSDVDAIKQTPRDERKQLFVTNISVNFTKSLLTAQWEKNDRKSGSRRTRGTNQQNMMNPMMGMPGMPGMGMPGMPGMPGMGMPGMPGMGPGMPGGGAPGVRRAAQGEVVEEEIEDGPGFLVVIEGYCPYKKIEELMDPHSVADDKAKWGFVTRLANLGTEEGDGLPFELFEKDNLTHFELKTGKVDIDDSDMPVGIGTAKEFRRVPMEEVEEDVNRPTRGVRRRNVSSGDKVETEESLIDPMTQEEICKTLDLVTQEEADNDPEITEREIGNMKYDEFDDKPKYIVRDHWFRVQAKFRWKDAPKDFTEDDADSDDGK